MMPKLNILNSLILLLISTYLVHERFTDEHVQFQEISVERLNVVGKDGNKYVVISSPERQALPTIDGKPTDPNKTERPVPGLLFFNSEGDEIGGLIYDISPTNSFQLLTFDQRKNDQLMALRKDESLVDGKWQRRYGLQLYELSDKPLNEKIAEYNRIKAMTDSVQRAQQFKQFFSDPDNKTKIKMHVGRLFNGKYGFFLFDDSGKARLSIYLDEDGTPKIEQVE